MDVVYLVRPGDKNDELRWSLRCLSANLPHERVWIVGYRPRWVTGVEHVPTARPGPSKWITTRLALREACAKIEVERFVLFNDDFFVTRPIESVPTLHRGTLAEHARHAKGAWGNTLRDTMRFLIAHGIPEPLSFDLHVPMEMERAPLCEVLDMVPPGVALQARSLYGNWAHVPATKSVDVKVHGRQAQVSPDLFLSTSDSTFNGSAGRWIRQHFPAPSPYERH